MGYTKEEVNKILDLKGANGEGIDVFSLHGVIFIGNSKDGQWDLTVDGRYCRFSEHSICLSISDFDNCEDEDEVNEAFFDALKRTVVDRLL